MLKTAFLVTAVALAFSACTVNVNSPGNTGALSPMPSANPTTSPTTAPSTAPSGNSSASPEPEIPMAGLIEYFNFSEAPPTDTEQATGVTQTPDRLGNANQAWHFNGGDSFFRVDRDLNGEALPQVTLSAWVRSTNPDNPGHIISHDNANTSRILGFLSTPDAEGWGAATGPNTGNTTLVPVKENTWQHLTVSYDNMANEVTFYVDGQLIQKDTELAPRGGYEYFYVGASPFSGKFFEGDIDEVRVYNRVLSAEEVQRLYSVSKTQ